MPGVGGKHSGFLSGFPPSAEPGGNENANRLVLLDELVASQSASLEFNNIKGDFTSYLFDIIGLVPATNAVNLLARVSLDGGASFVSSAVYHSIAQGADSGGTAADLLAQNTGTSMILHPTLAGATNKNISNDSLRGFNGKWWMFDPASSVRYTMFRGIGVYLLQGGTNYMKADCANVYPAVNRVDGIQFFVSSGAIASATIRLYGVGK